MKQAENFFSDNDQERISSSIREVETKTAGEVAVMLVNESDTYPESLLLGGLLLGCAVALAVTDQYFHDSLWTFLPLAIVLSVLIGWVLRYMPYLKRLFTPASRLEERVRNRALQAFYEKGLYQTKDATGVLFFISLFEHRVWVLADKGIYEKIAPAELQAYAADIAQGIKTGAAADALCREIAKVGDILARHFPIKPDDTDELSNKVIIG